MENKPMLFEYMAQISEAYAKDEAEEVKRLEAFGKEQTLSFYDAEVLAAYILDTVEDVTALLIQREQKHFDILVSAMEKSGNFSTALINEIIDKDRELNKPMNGDQTK